VGDKLRLIDVISVVGYSAFTRYMVWRDNRKSYMSKTVSPFVFTGIVLAAVNAANASGLFVQSIVDARLPLKGKPSESQIKACILAMKEAWRINKLDTKTLKTYSSCAGTLLSCPMAMLLKACESGTGRNGVMERVNEMKNPPTNSTKPRVGRPSGKGAGKTPMKNSGAAVDPLAPTSPMKDAPSPMHFWVRELNTLSAGATILRDTQNRCLSAKDANALKDAVSKCIALLGKYTI